MKRWLYIVALIMIAGSVRANITMIVAADGSGDHKTLQQAIDAVSVYSDEVIDIHIKPGVYREKVLIPAEKPNIRLLGEDAATTIIAYDDFSGKGNINTFTSYTIKICCNNFYAEKITFANTAGPVGQAVAVHDEGDCCVFRDCRFLGDQDTLFAAGENSRQYFQRCYIEGTTDFVFGPSTAVFDHCNILCKKNSYITAASTPQKNEFGYVFIYCKVEAASGITEVYLGRPWRDYANVVFMNCELGNFIRPEGWHNWSKPEREKTAFYAEYKNSGLGAEPGGRVGWSKQLTDEEAQKYTIENILKINEWKFN